MLYKTVHSDVVVVLFFPNVIVVTPIIMGL